MDRVTTTLIDLAEAAYDFESRDSEWLPGILASGLPLLDHGLGVAGGIFARSRDGREAVLRELHLIAVPERCARRLARIAADIPQTRWEGRPPTLARRGRGPVLDGRLV